MSVVPIHRYIERPADSATNAQGSTSYTYDNNGLRVRKSTGLAGGTTIFVYDAEGHLLGEYDASGNPIREIVWLGDMPLAVFTPDSAYGANAAANAPQVYYIHADHLNTPRVVVDRANTVRWRWMSEPFGTTAAESSPAGQTDFVFNLRFPGQYYDVESGIHQNWNRDYVPGLGRYAQSDPIGLNGGLNTYGYVGGSPILYVDPMGLARILKPDFKSFNDGVQWVKRYQELFDQNNAMRERIKKNCPNLLKKFDDWAISLDPNIDRGYGKRAGSTFATTRYSTQSSQFNWPFFNREIGDPSAAAIFAHEFRHLMDENNNMSRPGDGFRDPKKTPAEMDADAWASKFWSEQCDCR
ncbi:RHS repeat domain-containing protein [Acidovorax sp. NCPPB 3576]|uniref:RHS repeat domain-containing protein n=1 Tax=Acidovorax sp. NCPPB 3576 TaxID=2940488 RepID=UPI00234B16A8|nr:RHS repeat-associated core domain-containing protein [Acidovorax sp. NCPPB 3576]WCM86281.1 hypothetical protein M5C98_12820 [Acidovorax sp. NCPPB 3576]